MYPIFSPSKLSIKIKAYANGKEYISPSFKFSSSSTTPLNIIVNDLINSQNLKGVTAFTIMANSKNGKIPTRLNHQLIYGDINRSNSLQCSINVSLTNKKVFVPKKKTSFAWGQIINHKDYNSKLGLCFKTPETKEEKVKITFYNDQGLAKSFSKNLKAEESIIIDVNKIFGNSKKFQFYWYTATCKNPYLNAYSFHINKISGNSSGEHNF